MAKKVVFVIASHGYQPIEYGEPKSLLEGAGFEVFTASDTYGTAIAKDGTSATVDIIVDDIKIGDYQALYFIGGPGALEYLDNLKSYSLLQEWKKARRPYGAICISPRILAKAGVLRGKKATGWDGDGNLRLILQENGAIYAAEDDVVVDGNIITANGPGAVHDFGKAIIAMLSK